MSKNASKRGNGEGSLYKRSGNKNWYMAWYDENGMRQTRSTKSTDKVLAKKVLADVVDRVDKIAAGLIDPVAETLIEEGKRPIGELAKKYGDKLRAEGRTQAYCKRTTSDITDFAHDAGVSVLKEITQERAVAYLDSLRKQGKSNRTMQGRITSVKSFTRWSWSEGRLAADPLAGLKRPNPETDRRLRRRMMSTDEWAWFSAWVLSAPTRYDMSGVIREMLYTTAIQTGLRANELRSLKRSSLFLNSEKPYILVEAQSTKNRKQAKQYIRPELASKLHDHARRMSPGTKVFKVPTYDTAKMLHNDMAGARLAWITAAAHNPEEQAQRVESDFLKPRDSEGLSLDFHALRHTCGAWAAMGGTGPNAIQRLMRHSTITLTLDTYGHMLPDEASETVGKMPGFDDQQLIAATGTMGVQEDYSNCDSNRQPKARDAMQESATECDEEQAGTVIATIGNGGTWRDEMRPDASACLNSPARIRTGDQAIMSRAL